MKNNPLKRALHEGTQTYGTWITIPNPLIPEILSQAGFDWITVDMEHSAIGLNDLLPLVISIEANNMVPLVRVGENNPNLIKRVMDVGAYGVIVPNVNTREQALAAVNAVKYPPIGTRGVGLFRAQRYGREFEAYKAWLARESVVIVQIEHIDAVNNIDEILSVPGIDGFIVGPYDLSGSLGKPGVFDDPEVVKALSIVMEAANRYGITAGFHSVSSSAEEAIKRREQGYKFLAFSLDTIFLGDMACAALSILKGNNE